MSGFDVDAVEENPINWNNTNLVITSTEFDDEATLIEALEALSEICAITEEFVNEVKASRVLVTVRSDGALIAAGASMSGILELLVSLERETNV